ncbi:MAG: 4'-phosphopantetheinyl transferase family protein [Thermomonas sp.]
MTRPLTLPPSIPADRPGDAEPAWLWRPLLRDVSAEQQARAWLAGRLECAPDALPLGRTPYGRPRLSAPFERDDTSWSHSGQGLLIAHARDAMVGVDLEYERPRKHVLALAQRYFHADETAWLAAQADDRARQSAFIRLWCAKEAVLKAHGRGLAFGLDRLQFIERDGTLRLHACDAALGNSAHWHLRELHPQAGYRAALAWYPGILPG